MNAASNLLLKLSSLTRADSEDCKIRLYLMQCRLRHTPLPFPGQA